MNIKTLPKNLGKIPVRHWVQLTQGLQSASCVRRTEARGKEMVTAKGWRGVTGFGSGCGLGSINK